MDKLYPEPDAPTIKARENAQQLENSFVNNWLIVQNAESDLDNEGTHIWQSRDIAPQQTIYVGVEDSTVVDDDFSTLSFPNRTKFREWQLEHGVQIYAYQLDAACKNGFISDRTVLIGGEDDEKKRSRQDSEKVWLVSKECYALNFGLRFQKALLLIEPVWN